MPWILQRPVCGAYNKLFNFRDLLNTDEVSFQHFIRNLAALKDSLHYIECDISKNQTRLRQPISAKKTP